MKARSASRKNPAAPGLRAEAGRNVITAAKPKRRGGRNVFYVGSKQEMALEYISACALFSRAFNQLADADVYEQTFWDRDKKKKF